MPEADYLEALVKFVEAFDCWHWAGFKGDLGWHLDLSFVVHVSHLGLWVKRLVENLSFGLIRARVSGGLGDFDRGIDLAVFPWRGVAWIA